MYSPQSSDLEVLLFESTNLCILPSGVYNELLGHINGTASPPSWLIFRRCQSPCLESFCFFGNFTKKFSKTFSKHFDFFRQFQTKIIDLYIYIYIYMDFSSSFRSCDGFCECL